MQDVSINKITLLKVLAQAIMVSWLLIQIFCEQFFITMTRLDEVVFVAHIGVKAMLILALRFFFVSSLVHSIY